MSSNTNKSFVGWMNKNRGKTAAGFIFFVALVTLIVWIVNRGDAGPGAATGLPELEVSGDKTVKSIKKSEYSIMPEYALGDYLGDNIDFKLTLNTKGGFEENNIVKLVAMRVVTTNGTDTVLVSKDITNIKNYSEYVVDFTGLELTQDAVTATGGANTFRIIGYTGDAKYETVNPLATTDVTISIGDLNYVLANSMVSTFAFSLATGANATILGVARDKLSRSKYYLSIMPNVPLSIIPAGDGYSFQLEDKTTLLSVNDVTVYKLDKFGDKYRLYSEDKIMTRIGGTGAAVLKLPNTMTAAEADIALMRITTSPILPVKASKVRIYKGRDQAVGDDRFINLGEVFVYDTAGNNVAFKKTVTGNKVSGVYETWLPQLVDSDTTTIAHTGQDGVLSAKDESQKNWLEIDLGAMTDIQTVVIVNRDGSRESKRGEGLLLEFYDTAGSKVHFSSALEMDDLKNGLYHTYDTVTEVWTHEREQLIKYEHWMYVGNVDNTKYLRASITGVGNGGITSFTTSIVDPGTDSVDPIKTGSIDQSQLWMRNIGEKWQLIVKTMHGNAQWGMLNIEAGGSLSVINHGYEFSWKLMRGPAPNKYWLVHEPTGKMLYINKAGTSTVIEDFSPEKSKMVTMTKCIASLCPEP